MSVESRRHIWLNELGETVIGNFYYDMSPCTVYPVLRIEEDGDVLITNDAGRPQRILPKHYEFVDGIR